MPLFILRRSNRAVFRRDPESIKPDDEDEDCSKDIDTEDIDSGKTEGDELKQ